MTLRFDGQVAIVTGAGNGLGRAHAMALAERGARVVVNDLGGAVDGDGRSRSAADMVAEEIRSAGGEAIASGASVISFAEVEGMVSEAVDAWGRVDVLVNNAGILRDRTFANMSMDDFRAVVEVHLMGAANCTKAVWEIMRRQEYGRVVMTVSASGLYGNFGQANYSAAKMALVGLMHTLHLEGTRQDIRVNALAPAAVTRMTEAMVSAEERELLGIDAVTPALLYLAGRDAPSRLILSAGAGVYAATRVCETRGIYLPPELQTPEQVAAHIEAIRDPDGQEEPADAHSEVRRMMQLAASGQSRPK